jgi:hypothetical protein
MSVLRFWGQRGGWRSSSVEEEGRWLKWRSLGEDTGIVEKADASRKTVVIVEVARMMLEVADSWGRLGNRYKGGRV